MTSWSTRPAQSTKHECHQKSMLQLHDFVRKWKNHYVQVCSMSLYMSQTIRCTEILIELYNIHFLAEKSNIKYVKYAPEGLIDRQRRLRCERENSTASYPVETLCANYLSMFIQKEVQYMHFQFDCLFSITTYDIIFAVVVQYIIKHSMKQPDLDYSEGSIDQAVS